MRLILDNAQFRVLLCAYLTMSMGHLLFMMLQPWLALETTDSAFWVGATVGAAGAGLLSFSVIGGVIADRFPRNRVLASALCVQTLVSGAVAALALTGQLRLPFIMLFGFVDAAMLAVVAPSSLALVLDVVGRKRLLTALAIQQAVSGVAGIGMPLAAGKVLDSLDIGWAYAIVAGCHLAGMTLMLTLRPARTRKAGRTSPLADLKEAARYVFRTPVVRTLILGILFIEYFGFMHEPMVPIMARDILKAGPTGLGYLFSAAYAGGLAASLVMSSIGDVRHKGRLMAFGIAVFGGFLVAFAWSRNLPLSLVLFGLGGAGMLIYDTTIQTLLQVVVPDEMRGRVLGFQSLSWGIVWSSGFLTGAIAEAIGAPATITLGSGVVVGVAAVLYPRVARIGEAQPDEEATPGRPTSGAGDPTPASRSPDR